MFITISGMLAISGTFLGGLVSQIYSIPILGLLAFGSLITVGRYLGITGVTNGSNPRTFIGAGILVLGYAWFGGGILHFYSESVQFQALFVTGVITTLMTLIAGLYVYISDEDLSHWSRYSSIAFIGAILTALLGSFITPIVLLSFGLTILGFVTDLVYQIWVTSNSNRSPYVNGIAIYVAFAGVFVHVLQIVIQLLAQD